MADKDYAIGKLRFDHDDDGTTTVEVAGRTVFVVGADGTISGLSTSDRLGVKAFGAKGDGSTDDTAAIQSAIDAAPVFGGEVHFPPGNYVISSPIQMHNLTGGVGVGLSLVGSSGGARSSGASAIIWNGASGGNMVELFSRDCTISRLHFKVANGGNARSAIWVDRAPGGAATTANTFRQCRFEGLVSGGSGIGTMDYGVVIGDTATEASNLDFMLFDRCEFRGNDIAGFWINNNQGQSKGHVFRDCWFTAASSATTYKGAAIKTHSGAFRTNNCFFTGWERCIWTEAPDDTLLITDSLMERCKRFLATNLDGATTTKMWTVVIRGGVFNYDESIPLTPFDDTEAYNGEQIYYTHSGTLTIEGTQWGDVATYDADFKIHAGSSSRPVEFRSVSNVFPNDDPYNLIEGTRIYASSCRGLDASAAKVTLPEITHQSLDIATATTELTGLSGATATASSLIPAGSMVIGLGAYVTTAITGPASFDIGDGTDVDKFGAAIALAQTTTVDMTDSTVTAPSIYTAATDVVLTANGGTFSTGAVRLVVHYIKLNAPTS